MLHSRAKQAAAETWPFLTDIKYLVVALVVLDTLEHSSRPKEVFFGWKALMKNALQV